MGEFKLIVYIVLGATGAVVFAFSLPALTDGGPNGESATEQQARLRSSESSYCRQNLDRVNCHCFGRVAGYILEHDAPRARGFVYADPSGLARKQAGSKC